MAEPHHFSAAPACRGKVIILTLRYQRQGMPRQCSCPVSLDLRSWRNSPRRSTLLSLHVDPDCCDSPTTSIRPLQDPALCFGPTRRSDAPRSTALRLQFHPLVNPPFSRSRWPCPKLVFCISRLPRLWLSRIPMLGTKTSALQLLPASARQGLAQFKSLRLPTKVQARSKGQEWQCWTPFGLANRSSLLQESHDLWWPPDIDSLY
jgi:hypothetical protein